MNVHVVGETLVVAAVLAGCSSSGTPAPTASPTTVPASATASPTESPTPTVTALTTPSSAAKPVLILESDGLGVLVGASSIRHFTFAGTASADVTTVVRNVLGPGQTSALPDCGQGRRSTYQVRGFSLLFDGRKFVGWTDQGAPGRTLTTADNVGVGVTRRQLDGSGTAFTYERTTLGEEFHAGSLGGILSGTRVTDAVTAFYAGETCFFR